MSISGTFSSLTLPSGYTGTMSYTATKAVLIISGIPAGGGMSINPGITNVDVAVQNGLNNIAELQAYPNPMVNNCVIQSNSLIQSIKVYDVSGKLIKTSTNIHAYQYQLQMNGQAAGTYFVSVIGDGFVQTRTVIKK